MSFQIFTWCFCAKRNTNTFSQALQHNSVAWEHISHGLRRKGGGGYLLKWGVGKSIRCELGPFPATGCGS
jgi:hypothetical protein